jgi:periplasmic protein TonB
MFDTALLESRKGPKGRGKAAGLPLATGLHVLVIGAFVGASVWNVGEPPEPVIPVTFYAPPAGPPPPPGGGGHVGSHTATPPRNRVPEMVQPVVMPVDPIKPGNAEAADEPEYKGEDLGQPSGEPTGIPGGTGNKPGGNAESGAVDTPIRLGGDVKAPLLVSRIDPEYPEAARLAHMQGVVILEAIITADGAVEDLTVLKSANPLLDAAAERAVRQWRYRPATLNGRAVKVYLTVTVTFGLRS